MKILKFLAVLLLLFVVGESKAQYTLFSKSGTITYDKTMYIKNIIAKQFVAKADENSRHWFQEMVSTAPQSVTIQKTLKFNGSETLFEPVKKELDPASSRFIMQLALDFDGVTSSNLEQNSYRRFNDIFGEKIVIADTLKTIKWKITDEYREIAGYNCRRANGVTSDSIYVIGFYANELPVYGGPESINGLPGMILGLVVPNQHVSYFASKVELSSAPVMDKKVFEAKKVKVLSRAEVDKQFTQTLSSGMMTKEMVKYIMQLLLM
ncbi:GLPGLI family protein [Sphingobacterium sp. SG20118]|uniref:GLPGLI family protein n=1 Tax=unclassified Sphingobacterium TaxID=2609468 RepID=UPI0004F89FF8|nr:GLPGLI family protein [Sphingobacterium sp. ML3W]AIM35900.1 hypothetical protein KO02_03785 [Sphingobacterium sp. ML3W]